MHVGTPRNPSTRTVLSLAAAQKVTAYALVSIDAGEHVGSLAIAQGTRDWTATLWTFDAEVWGPRAAQTVTESDLYPNSAALAIVRYALSLPRTWEPDDPTRGMEWRGVLHDAGIRPLWALG